MKTFIQKEVSKFRKSWRLYVVMVCLFSFTPMAIDALYKSYYPFDVLDPLTQPYEVEKQAVAPGEVQAYIVHAQKHYPFKGTVNRYLYSEKCNIFEPIQPPVETNFPQGEVHAATNFVIPEKTKPCPYVLLINVVYHPTSWRDLPAVELSTVEFLVTEKPKQAEAVLQGIEQIEDNLEDKIINE